MLRHRAVRIGGIVVGVLVLGLVLASSAFAPIAPPAPPTIGDILGIWNFTWTGVEHNLASGLKERFRAKGTCTITQTGPTIVNMDFVGDTGGSNVDASYSAGILVSGGADDDVLATESWTEYFVIRGRPGHLTAKGQFISYVGTSLEYASVSLKQQP